MNKFTFQLLLSEIKIDLPKVFLSLLLHIIGMIDQMSLSSKLVYMNLLCFLTVNERTTWRKEKKEKGASNTKNVYQNTFIPKYGVLRWSLSNTKTKRQMKYHQLWVLFLTKYYWIQSLIWVGYTAVEKVSESPVHFSWRPFISSLKTVMIA